MSSAAPWARRAAIVAGYWVLWAFAWWVSGQYEVAANISPWYFPAGITFALLLVCGLRYLPAVLAIEVAVWLFAMPHLPALWIVLPVLIAGGYGLGAWVLGRILPFDRALRRGTDILLLTATAAVAAGAVALAGTALVVVRDGLPWVRYDWAAAQWWIGDVTGIVVLTPLLVLLGRSVAAWAEGERLPARPGPQPPRRRLRWKSALADGAIVAVGGFGGWLGLLMTGRLWLFMFAIPVLWVAYQHGRYAAAVAVPMLAAVTIVVLPVAGAGHGILETQLFVVSMSIAGLMLGAVAEAWRRSERALTERKAALEEEVEMRAGEVMATNRRLTDHLESRRAIEESLREISEMNRRQRMELETLYNGAPIGLGMFSRDLRFVRINEQLAEINGLPAADHVGHTLTEVVPGVAGQVVPLLERVIETGEPITGIEIRGETPKAPGLERVWLEAFYPVVMPGGEVEGVAAVVEDITERKRHEEQLRLAMRELNHRVRNTLTVVLSIASQTVRYSDSLDDFSGAFTRRLRSLASAHGLLSKSNWQSTPMRDLAVAVLSPYCDPDGDTARLEGEPLALLPSAALSMSMVLHELAANAAKYGALSASSGRVELSWRLEDDGATLVVRWRETGGPPVTVPKRSGFGTRLIRHTMAHEFGGDAAFAYRPEGLVCDLTMPWAEKDEPLPAAADPARAPPPSVS